MALQTLLGGGVMAIPSYRGATGAPSVNNHTLNEAADKAEMIIRMPKTGNLTKVGIQLGTVTTPATLNVRLETISATDGNATGNAYGGCAAGTLDPTGLGGTLQWVTLGTPAAATAGDRVAVVVSYASSAGDLHVAGSLTGWVNNGMLYSGIYDQTGAVWTKSTGLPIAGVTYNDNLVYNCGGFPFDHMTSVSYDLELAYDEYALKFRLPFPCRVWGAAVAMQLSNGSDWYFKLYEGTTERATSALLDEDMDAVGSGITTSYNIPFTTPYVIKAGTWYYVSALPNTSLSSTIFTYYVDAVGTWDGWEGGQDISMGKRANLGAWTDVPTARPLFAVIIDQVDDGAGIPKAAQLGGVLCE